MVDSGMVPVGAAASVEAVKADVQSSGVILWRRLSERCI